MEIKTLGCSTIEYSLKVGAPATTGTGSNTNLNTTKSKKTKLCALIFQKQYSGVPISFLTYFSKLGTPLNKL